MPEIVVTAKRVLRHILGVTWAVVLQMFSKQPPAGVLNRGILVAHT